MFSPGQGAFRARTPVAAGVEVESQVPLWWDDDAAWNQVPACEG